MTDGYRAIRIFLGAASREFNDIVDALGMGRRRSRASIIDAGARKGSLLLDQVVARFRTAEFDRLFAQAVACAAASPLKELLLPLLKPMRELQLELRAKAVDAEDAEGELPSPLVENYCRTIAALRAYIGAPGTGSVAEGTAEGSSHRTRGAKRRYNADRDEETAEAWQRARAAGVGKKDFAADNGMSFKDLDRLLNRVRKKRNAAD